MQWQMLSSDNQLTEMDYFSFAPQIGKAHPITVRADLKRQAELVEASMRFRLAVMTRVPLSGSEFDQAAKAFLVLNRKLKFLQAQLDEAKERVKKLANNEPAQGGGVIVTVARSDGRVSWEKIAQDLAARVDADEAKRTELIDSLKLVHKSAPTVTVSVKEAADADAVFAELLSSTSTETSVVEPATESVAQPNPNW